MKKFIKIESNFKNNEEGYDILCDIHKIKERELLDWLSNLLQKLVDDNIFSYDTLLNLVKYDVVDYKKDREKEYSKNLDSLLKEFIGNIEDMLSEDKNDN